MTSHECEIVQWQLSDYHDGELSVEHAHVVASHIESCPHCAAELQAFESLGSLVVDGSTPDKPAELWQRIESELSPTAATVFRDRARGSLSLKPAALTRLVALAASVLLMVGAGVWYERTKQTNNRSGVGEETVAAGHSHAGHTHGAGVSSAHAAEFARVMSSYFKQLSSDPDGAEAMLAAKYHGVEVDAEEAVRLVGYRPIVSSGMPEGYSLASTSVLKMPCCTCVKAVCRREDGSTLVLFEHDDEQTAWFDGRPSRMATCGDKECCIVELDSDIAATWRQGTRSVTAVGVRDQGEVASLVEWLNI